MFYSREKKCIFLPIKEDRQQTFKNLFNGFLFEFILGSFNADTAKIENLKNEEGYSLDEVVEYIDTPVRDEDKAILARYNICIPNLIKGYHPGFCITGKSINDYIGEEKIAYKTIEDKNTCFNSEKFSNLKDLLDCRYTEIKYTSKDNIEKSIKTCYFIPNEKCQKNSINLLNMLMLTFLWKNI